MKGSRVQAIIKELRGEKIDIIEWSDEPSVFAANALSPAKVSQVRITDIDKRKMHVIVSEDQLSLAIGKKGQNVRLATRLVGWDIDIVSEEVLKKEIALQMGRMMASGEAVPLTAIEGVTANQADLLAAKGIEDVEKLATTSIDDLVDILDVTFDDAERILSAAQAVVAAKEADVEVEADGTGEEAGATEDGEAPRLEASSDVEPSEGGDAEEPGAPVTEVSETEVEPTEVTESEVTETEPAHTEVIGQEVDNTELIDAEPKAEETADEGGAQGNA
jgi:transcription termination/antitermination protein NusA